MAETLLIVDDDLDLRRSLTTFLTQENYECRHAGTGTQALESLNDELPDLMLLDIILPDISGRELLTRVREQFELPVICLSGRKDVIDCFAGLERGADDYFVKPFDPDALLAGIRAVLDRSRPNHR